MQDGSTDTAGKVIEIEKIKQMIPHRYPMLMIDRPHMFWFMVGNLMLANILMLVFGLLGTGPGEGQIKTVLPDAHADFIFAVAGEEFGTLACLLIVALFAFIVLRGFTRVLRDNDLFVLLAVAGLLVQFGLQALINMASALHLIPPKGMTLPFISYGGSSTIALAFGMGMVLALTRRRKGDRT